MPSIVSGFEYDIFISYRQKDNKYDGWVTEFVDNLKRELEATFKEEISVYFDINPHDGLLETHDVDASLNEKLKCLIFIPIVSQTYCDSKSFAWEHEFKTFIEQASTDQFGLKIKLPGGNVANRILPVQIHDLDIDDKALLEKELGGVLRAIEFIYKEAGVNRPLRSNEENPAKNLNQTIYRNQVNKVANAIKDIINGIKYPSQSSSKKNGTEFIQYKKHKSPKRTLLAASIFVLLLAIMSYFLFQKKISLVVSDTGVEKSIAVLPFTDMSQGQDQEYLGDGVAQEIQEQLSKFNDLVVIARLSSFYFKNKNEDIREIGKKLNASFILAGSIRKEDNLYRVIVELINASTGRTIYSEPYNYEAKKIISLESDIAVDVAQKIKSRLTSNNKLQVTHKKEVNPEAYEAYLKGRMEINKGPIPVTNHKNARKYFQSAVAIDPGFAEAYSFLSFAYVNLSQFSFSLKEKKSILDSVKYFAEKAIELDENNYLAHLAMSNIYWPVYDLINFMKEINKAYEIDPVGARMPKAVNLVLIDEEDDEGIRLAKEGATSDPLNIDVLKYYASIMSMARRYDECIAINKQVVALDSNQWDAHAQIGWCYLFKNEIKNGLQEWSKCMQGYKKSDLAQLFLTSDFKTAMEAFFKWQKAENEGSIINKYIGFANVYAYLKDRVNTLKYLELAYNNNEDLTGLKKSISFDFIRKDPEYIAIYKKAGFKAYDEYKAGIKK